MRNPPHRPRRLPLRRRSRPTAPHLMAAPMAALHRSFRSLLRRRRRRTPPDGSARSLCRTRIIPRRRLQPAPLSKARARLPEPRRPQPATMPRHRGEPLPGARFPPPSGASSGSATKDVAGIAIRLPGAAVTRRICCRSTTCCRSPKGAARIRELAPGVLCSPPAAPPGCSCSATGAANPIHRCCCAEGRRTPCQCQSKTAHFQVRTPGRQSQRSSLAALLGGSPQRNPGSWCARIRAAGGRSAQRPPPRL